MRRLLRRRQRGRAARPGADDRVHGRAPPVAPTVAGRYSGTLYTTLDNADVHPNTYQGFSEWFVADARATDRIDRENFLFHPFPERTVVATARVGL